MSSLAFGSLVAPSVPGGCESGFCPHWEPLKETEWHCYVIEHQPMCCQYQGYDLPCMRRNSVPGKKNKQRSMCISEVSLQLLLFRAVITASLSDWNCMCFPCQCLPQIAHDRRIGSISSVAMHWLVRASCDSHGCWNQWLCQKSPTAP